MVRSERGAVTLPPGTGPRYGATVTRRFPDAQDGSMSAAGDEATHPFAGATGLLEQVGNTPLIRLDAVAGSVPAGVSVWGKAEWFNPGGSVKDRPALSIVLDAERRGVLRPGATILDASSGNTGIAYAMV